MNWQDALGRPVSATDQPPGTYRYRTKKGAPWQPLKIMLTDNGLWHVLLCGRPVSGSPARDPEQIQLVLWRGPFDPISEHEYRALVLEHEMAPAGSPLRNPDEPVNLRQARPL
jgi:hypothetical protein